MLKPLDNLRKIIEMIRPNFSSYMRFPVEGLVTAVDAEAYTCDVQPLNTEMSPFIQVQDTFCVGHTV